jgi:hypothetical protein
MQLLILNFAPSFRLMHPRSIAGRTCSPFFWNSKEFADAVATKTAYLTKLMMDENFKKHERTLPRKSKFTKTAVFVPRVQKREAFERESKFCEMMRSTFIFGPAEMMCKVRWDGDTERKVLSNS